MTGNEIFDSEPADTSFVGEDEDHSKCSFSVGVHKGATVGQGTLDANGYWSRPCTFCARKQEKEHPEGGAVWPLPVSRKLTLKEEADWLRREVRFYSNGGCESCAAYDTEADRCNYGGTCHEGDRHWQDEEPTKPLGCTEPTTKDLIEDVGNYYGLSDDTYEEPGVESKLAEILTNAITKEIRHIIHNRFWGPDKSGETPRCTKPLTKELIEEVNHYYSLLADELEESTPRTLKRMLGQGIAEYDEDGINCAVTIEPTDSADSMVVSVD